MSVTSMEHNADLDLVKEWKVAHLPEQFDQALGSVEPGDADKESASRAHTVVRSALESEPALAEMEIDTILIGSYARQVSIRRMKDVDVFSKLGRYNSTLSPEALLTVFERVLSSEFGSARVKRRTRTVEVDFPDDDLFVDVVPARPAAAEWEIPDRQGEWIATNPERLTELTSEINERFRLGAHGAYVPIVKLIRQIRVAQLQKHPAGMYLEVLCYWAFDSGTVGGSSVAEYLTRALEGMCPILEQATNEGLQDPTLAGRVVQTKADQATLSDCLDTLRRISADANAALADADECRAAKRWRDMLGKNDVGSVFPMPEHCTEEGERREVGRRPGSRVVPVGEGKFAWIPPT
jgi:hypothetical protein